MIKYIPYITRDTFESAPVKESIRWAFRVIYAPSNETLRREEEAAHNKNRMEAYYNRLIA